MEIKKGNLLSEEEIGSNVGIKAFYYKNIIFLYTVKTALVLILIIYLYKEGRNKRDLDSVIKTRTSTLAYKAI